MLINSLTTTTCTPSSCRPSQGIRREKQNKSSTKYAPCFIHTSADHFVQVQEIPSSSALPLIHWVGPHVSQRLQVDACFHRIAGHLSGIALSRPQLEAAGGVISANIVNHRRHDEEVNGGEVPDYTSRRSKNCAIS